MPSVHHKEPYQPSVKTASASRCLHSFVNYEMEREAYLSWNSQYNSETWSSGKVFYTGQDVVNPDTSVWYTCKLTHTANSTNKPETGVNWATYWNAYVEPDYYDTYVNKLEDLKFIYGGVEAFNLSYIKYYSTSTQLVLELTQYCYPDDQPYYEYTPCPADKVYVDYTIFYNPAGEEFNLLSYVIILHIGMGKRGCII